MADKERRRWRRKEGWGLVFLMLLIDRYGH